MTESAIRLQVEEVEPGVFVATSTDVPGLVAEGRSVVEAAEIAQGLARRIAESCLEHGDPLPAALSTDVHTWPIELVIPVGVGCWAGSPVSGTGRLFSGCGGWDTGSTGPVRAVTRSGETRPRVQR
jgi:antitoxin HicB